MVGVPITSLLVAQCALFHFARALHPIFRPKQAFHVSRTHPLQSIIIRPLIYSSFSSSTGSSHPNGFEDDCTICATSEADFCIVRR